jgi:hypothetical protein
MPDSMQPPRNLRNTPSMLHIGTRTATLTSPGVEGEGRCEVYDGHGGAGVRGSMGLDNMSP